ncbi:hypothetical protein [Psychrilyobacter atlanticus]|uniref:hypothetical protein n=1 Tax=Psychrilyobacter atlanticus TaxID=271091 RepID=UPI00041F62C5|nr:hypothetical protein [Psychrilyobacter atlanticus]
MSQVLKKLKGGDLRSIGKSDEVVQEILDNPSLFSEVFEGMLSNDPIIKMRSADAVEKVSAKHPEYLQPFKTKLINEISKVKQQEVQWHAAQMFSYIKIDKTERNKIINILLSYIKTTDSNIVKVFSMQTLADFAEKDQQLQPQIVKLIRQMMEQGTPSIVSRGKKLINRLKREK